MRLLIDTNVLLRSAEPLHAHHQVSADAIDLLRQRDHDLLIAPQILYEFWSVAARPIEQNGLGMSTAEANAEMTAIQRLFRLLRDERAVFPIWAQLVNSHGVKGKQTHDARIAAAIQRHGVPSPLTFNAADFARYAFVRVLMPNDVLSGVAAI